MKKTIQIKADSSEAQEYCKKCGLFIRFYAEKQCKGFLEDEVVEKINEISDAIFSLNHPLMISCLDFYWRKFTSLVSSFDLNCYPIPPKY